MKKCLVLANRELSTYFYSPMAYVIGAMFLAVTALIFFHGLGLLDIPPVFRPGEEASLRSLFEAMAYIMVFTAPLLTMRLMSEEFRSGTIEKMLTTPISDTQIVLGKFLGVMSFYAVLLATTLVFMGLVARYGQPDAGVAVMGYLGMLLLGAAFTAVGIFTSSITRYQILAALVGITILSVFTLLMGQLAVYAPSPVSEIAARAGAMTYFRDFAKGMLDTRGLVYFISGTVLFLFLSVKSLESRRWR